MRLNKMGFTLIELLAVITILGILMIVGIPAVQRTINNSRKDTFVDTAKSYVNAVRTAWASDELKCGKDGEEKNVPSSLNTEMYYVVAFRTGSFDNNVLGDEKYHADANATALIQSGGKSSWGNNDVAGVVYIVHHDETTFNKSADGHASFYVSMIDEKGHGFGTWPPIDVDILGRNDVKEDQNDFVDLEANPSRFDSTLCRNNDPNCSWLCEVG